MSVGACCFFSETVEWILLRTPALGRCVNLLSGYSFGIYFIHIIILEALLAEDSLHFSGIPFDLDHAAYLDALLRVMRKSLSSGIWHLDLLSARYIQYSNVAFNVE